MISDGHHPEERGKGLTRSVRSRKIFILCIVAVLAVSSAFIFYDLNGKSFSLSDRQVVLIVTDSMDGDVNDYKIHSFPKDTVVMVQHLSDEEKKNIQIGDVLSFRQGNIINHHRVVDISQIDSGYVITKGDNAQTTEVVALSDVNGEVIGSNHWLGMVFTFVKEYYVFIILATIFLWVSAGLIRWAFLSDTTNEEV